MIPSQKCFDLIKSFEGLRLKAYKDAVGIPTIGYGTTRYDNGEAVKIGQEITEDKANELLTYQVFNFASGVNNLVKSTVNQNQFDSLVSFSYNVGLGALKKSTLLKKVNINPTDPTIFDEFLKWNKGGGMVLPGLTSRRKKEATLYFS